MFKYKLSKIRYVKVVNMIGNQEKQVTKKGKVRGEAKDYPVINLRTAIDVAKVVKDCGDSATRENLETGLGKKGGQLGNMIAGTRRYVLIKGTGEMHLTELAKKILHPTSEQEKKDAIKEAFFGVQTFKIIYERFNGKFPREDLFKNILIRNYGVKTEKEAVRLANIIRDSIKLFDESSQGNAVTNQADENFSEEDVLASLSKVKRITQPNNINNNIFTLLKNLGYMEALAEHRDNIKIDKDELILLVKDIEKLSSNFNSLNHTASMTYEELKSGMINKDVCLSRIKFFITAIKKDLGITEKVSQELDKSQSHM